MHGLIAPTFNFLVLLAILVYYLREPIRQFVHSRHVTVRDELKSVRELLRQAQEKHDEFSSKLKAIEAETTALREQAQQDAQVAKLRILSEAQRLSGNIVVDARATAEGLLKEMKNELYLDLAGRVLERAETILKARLTGDDRARFRQEFSMQVENVR
ncbi:MAG: ATP synthase F0 subunit B [Oligoflexia bacterium]|nr:ATP synthase F0 subunit B [Oligoflexia bacterium]